jgi:nucleoid-associated protein YgaU
MQVAVKVPYIWEEGDTLWSLARKFLGAGDRFPLILDVNPGIDPLDVSPGQRIWVPQIGALVSPEATNS